MAYLTGNLFLVPVWILLYQRRKDLRRKMLMFSFLIGFLGPISEYWYLQDYWKPETLTKTSIGIEDYLFGFLIGGISSVIYEELFAKKYSKKHNRKRHWALLSMFLGGVAFIIFGSLFYHLNFNSIYASGIAFIVIALIIIFFRRDLWFDAVASGVLCATILFLCFCSY